MQLGKKDLAKNTYMSSYHKDKRLLSVRKALHKLGICSFSLFDPYYHCSRRRNRKRRQERRSSLPCHSVRHPRQLLSAPHSSLRAVLSSLLVLSVHFSARSLAVHGSPLIVPSSSPALSVVERGHRSVQ